jgi:hypothetical protein
MICVRLACDDYPGVHPFIFWPFILPELLQRQQMADHGGRAIPRVAIVDSSEAVAFASRQAAGMSTEL